MGVPGLARRRRWQVLAGLTLLLAWLVPAHDPSWNQNAHYALVRALADGKPYIDRSVFEMRANVVRGGTGDVAVFHGHSYAAKAPGLAFWTLPAFLALKAAGDAKPSGDLYRILWLLTLWAAVLPATVLFLLVRMLADRVAPGYGTITAATLGVATLVLPFASLFFAHVLTAALAFGAFALLWHERHASARLPVVGCAGLLAGFAVTVELPSVILVGALAGYLLARERRLARMLTYCGGAALGVLPLLVFNQWAFGSITHLSYAGVAGGANRKGLFGVTIPSFHVASALLFSTIGLLRLAPVLLLAAVGVVFLYRQGKRAEALLIAGLSFAYLLFNSGYETPFGGYSPGPRFLVPLVPFLVLPLALVYQRLPVTTIVLAAASAVQMIVITMTNPLYAVFGNWFGRLWARNLDRTALGFGGGSHRAMPLFALLLLCAAVFAVLATPRPPVSRREIARGALALTAWLLIAYESPTLVHNGGPQLVLLYAAVTTAVLISLLVPRMLFAGPRILAADPEG
jgi:hypothetical protein